MEGDESDQRLTSFAKRSNMGMKTELRTSGGTDSHTTTIDSTTLQEAAKQTVRDFAANDSDVPFADTPNNILGQFNIRRHLQGQHNGNFRMVQQKIAQTNLATVKAWPTVRHTLPKLWAVACAQKHIR